MRSAFWMGALIVACSTVPEGSGDSGTSAMSGDASGLDGGPRDAEMAGRDATPVSDATIAPDASRALSLAGTVSFSCSGALFRLPSRPRTARAWVMTNGHCLGRYLGATEVVVDQAAHTELVLHDDEHALAPPHIVTRVVYATMHATDLAIFELEDTYETLEAANGVQPFALATEPPAPGLEVSISSGYHRSVQRCALEAVVPSLQEGQWLFEDSLRHTDGCVSIDGLSGAPVVSVANGEIVAVHNSRNEDGTPCAVGSPCELGPGDEVTTHAGAAYSQQTWWLHACVDAGGELDLARPDCELPRP